MDKMYVSDKWRHSSFRPSSYAALLLSLSCYWSVDVVAEPICAKVQIEISQDLALERQGFDAMMRITNGLSTLSLEDVGIDVTFEDSDGEVVLASSDPNDARPGVRFFIRVDELAGITAIDGTGTVAPNSTAEVHWLIIPTPGTAEDSPLGKLYLVGAHLSYTVGGKAESVSVAPDAITVKPLPQLALDYFLTSEVIGDDAFTAPVEPPEPYTLGLRIHNTGSGVARRVTLDSAEPKIIDNAQGLRVGFQVTGASRNDQPVAPTLRMDFGDLAPQAVAVGRWTLETPLSGRFVDFTARVAHSDALGGAVTALIDPDAMRAHVLLRDVRVDLPGRDRVRDFLAHPVEGSEATPFVYESEPAEAPVTNLSSQARFAAQSSQGSTVDHTLALPVTAGFVYARVPDPYAGTKVIDQVVRSDGKAIPLDNAWTSKTRDRSTSPPRWEHWVNLFDGDTTGTYAVRLGAPPLAALPPVLRFIPDQVGHEGGQVGFVAQASDPNGDGLILSAAPLPPGASWVDQGEGTAAFDWRPALGQAGRYPLTVKAFDRVLAATRTLVLTVHPAWDTDGDGMDDAWELRHFDTLDRDGRGDLDGDGISDLQEYLDGTDPTRPPIPIGPDLPGIEAPASGARIGTTTPTLVIGNSAHAAEGALTYEVEVYADGVYTRRVAAIAGLAETPTTTRWTVGPALADNTEHHWRVRAFDGSTYSPWVSGRFLVDTANEAPGPVTIWSPEQDAVVTTTRPTLVVTPGADPDGDPLRYTFEVFADATLIEPLAVGRDIAPDATGLVTWPVDRALRGNREYLWRVRVSDPQGSAAVSPPVRLSIDTANQAPAAPVIAEPLPDSTVTRLDAALGVIDAADPEGDPLLYTFELDTVLSFDSPALQRITDLPAGLGSTVWPVCGLVEDSVYHWRARAFDGHAAGPWARGRFRVNTVNDAPAVPMVKNPGDQASVDLLSPTLEVHPATDPDGDPRRYRFELYAEGDLAMPLDQALVEDGLWTVGLTLSPDTWYAWRARAEDAHGAVSDWTAPVRLYTNLDGLDDPPRIALTDPATAVEATAGGVPIRWEDQDPDSHATLDLYYDTDAAGFDGTLIVEGLAADPDGAADSFAWDPTALPPGHYHVYGVIRDASQQAQAYAPGAVIVPPPLPAPPPLPGDVDGDADVDLRDIAHIDAARRQPAAGPDDPRDVDADGRITARDILWAIRLCTCRSCAMRCDREPPTGAALEPP